MWIARGGLSLAREFSCALLRSPETESFLAGYPPETIEKKNNNKINNWEKLTVLGYKCPFFSFPVEIAPCCYTLDTGNKRAHLNVHVSVTKYIKKHVIKVNGEIQLRKSQIQRYFSHFPSTWKKNGVALVMQKFITSFLSVALWKVSLILVYHTIPSLISRMLNN